MCHLGTGKLIKENISIEFFCFYPQKFSIEIFCAYKISIIGEADTYHAFL